MRKIRTQLEDRLRCHYKKTDRIRKQMGKFYVYATTRYTEGAHSSYQSQLHLLVSTSGQQQHSEHHQDVGNKNRL